MHEVWALRRSGTLCAFTADAGPNLKVLCEPESEEPVRAALLSVRGIQSVRSSDVGGPVEIVRHEVEPSAIWNADADRGR